MEELDRDVVEWLSSLHWPVVTPVMKGLTYIGAGGTVWIAIGLIVAFRQRRPLVLVAGGTHNDDAFRIGVPGRVVECALLNLCQQAGLVDR